MTLLLLLACQTAPFPAPIAGTAYRIDEDVPAPDSEIRVDLLTSYADCVQAGVRDLEACLPRADRASGELHLAFRLRDPRSPTDLFRAITADRIRVTHDKSIQTDVELIPHEPIGAGQLFLILLDGSGSMYANGGERIQKVYSALLEPSVVDRFFPPDNPKTGVVFLRFQEEVRSLDGGPTGRILRTRREYEDMVRTHLMKPSGGFTHLYDAIEFAVTELLDQDAIRDFLAVQAAEPTVILVTDGFNNEEANDTCATNVPRLQRTLDLIRDVRSNQGGTTRPTLYTLGLGVPYRKGNKPEGLNRQVTTRDLCGRYGDDRIDTVLDAIGIDHVSLQWIAEVGGGSSFVKNNATGLAETLEAAAATRYRWYEVWYRVPDSFYHRKSFEVELRLQGFERALSTVRVHPSAWMDAPTAAHETGARWHTQRPFLHSLTLLMPALGVLLMMIFLAPALFNARRAIFRRVRPRRRPR